MEKYSSRVAVTGAAGFIGSNLCQALLSENYRVVGIDNLSAGTRENIPQGINFHQRDILDTDLRDCLAGCETLFHLAAKNCLSDCAAHPVETARVNVMGTANVLEAARAAGVKHLIYADTSAEYEGIGSFPSSVNHIRPLSVYACSKRGGALMAEAFSQLHPIAVSYVRYFNVYGPAQDFRRVVPPVMSAFVLRLLRGESPVIYGDGKKSRDFIHVDDVNAFHLKLLKEPALWGKTFNLGSGESHTILEIFQKIQRLLSSTLAPEHKPDLPMEAQMTLADIKESLATGWSPKIRLEEGLQDFIQYTKRRLAT